MGEYLLRTNALTKEFGRHKAVNKVNFYLRLIRISSVE